MDSARALRFIDVFAGCGGISLGFLQAGLRGILAVERDPYAFSTFRHNLLDQKRGLGFDWPAWAPQSSIDIRALLTDSRQHLNQLRGTVDVLAGGPPCQGFSSAGRRHEDDPRNQLFRAYLSLVDQILPRAVLLENVRGFTMTFGKTQRGNNYADELRQHLERDYNVFEEVIDLSTFGVPQHRIRYLLLAFRKDIAVPNPFEIVRRHARQFLRRKGIQTPVTSWSAISDLESLRFGTRHSTETKGFRETTPGNTRSAYQDFMAIDSNSPRQISDLRLANHSHEVSERFATIIDTCRREGRLSTNLTDDMRARFGLKKKALRVLDPDAPSPTITSMPDDLIHYSEPRTLTVRENARLQGFPDSFEFQGKYTTGGHRRRTEVPRFTQVANAVPPLVAQFIGSALMDMLDTRSIAELAGVSLEIDDRNPQVAEVLP